MSRIKILASTIPLLFAALLARTDLAPAPHPCISNGHVALQIATGPWQAQTHVSFTDDPARATVRVQIVDAAETADFAVTDDTADTTVGVATCGGGANPRFVGIADVTVASDPVIYLSRTGDADYRIFVDSRTFTPREAAALIVSAGHSRITAASL